LFNSTEHACIAEISTKVIGVTITILCSPGTSDIAVPYHNFGVKLHVAYLP